MRRSTPLAAACAALLALAACQDAPLTPGAAGSRPEAPRTPMVPSTDVRTGWVYGPGGEPMEVTFSVEDGWAIFEGDIKLGRADQIAKTREALTRAGGPSYGVSINGSGYRWPGGSVPYVIDAAFGSYERSVIQSAMSHVAGKVGGVSFKQRTTESSYVVFAYTTGGCNSWVGRQSGSTPQTINLPLWCAQSMGSTAHEIMHALGMWHEQSRCDRDTYVTINLANVIVGEEHNFAKKCSGSTTNFAYDEGSLMHYDMYAWSKNGQPTITSRRGLGHLMGQRSGMSAQDTRTLAWMYPSAPLISPIDWQNYEPILYWKNTGAATYDVYLVTIESWQHVYNGSGTDTWKSHLGSTSGTTFTDWYNTSTGNYYCDTTQDYMYEQRTQEYHYEVVASFGYNVIRSHRVPAAVGRC
jgi:Astacin (Peptidase family M12A)